MIYLDYQATTALAPEAEAAMISAMAHYGNPNSAHRFGRIAAADVELARDRVRAALGKSEGTLVFTSGATEALNIAIVGAARAAPAERRRVITVATEHAAVLDTVLSLRHEGFEPVILPVGPDGLVDLDIAEAAIDERAALLAIMQVNNEIGVVQPMDALISLARTGGVPVLCDAVQGFGKLHSPDADLIAISAHKIHGPKGIGALWLRKEIPLLPLLHGGGQEDGLRPGTLSPMLCAGFGVAAELAMQRHESDLRHVERLWATARDTFEGWIVNGSLEARYRGNLNIRKDGIDAARLISSLRGVAISLGSACASGTGRPSHVLRAIGLNDAEARSSLRIGFGRYTQIDDVERAAAAINEAADSAESRGMIRVHFVSADGGQVQDVEAKEGDSLLDVAQAAGQPLEGTCEGQMACSTCHVIVDQADFAKLPRASENEEDMLDLAAATTRYSRLACQITLKDVFEELTVRIPAESRNMQGI